MTGALVTMALGAVVTVLAVRFLHRALRAMMRVLKPAWYWFSGHSMDGVHRTNATWTKRSHGDRAVLHPSAIWWHHWPRRLRAAIRTVGTILALAIAYGLVAAAFITIACLCGATAAISALGACYAVHVLHNWRHERHYVKPLELTLTKKLRVQPDSVEVNVDRDEESGADVITSVVVEWPADTEIGPAEKDSTLEAVTTRLHFDAPEFKWELRGRARMVTFTPSEPPPFPVFWEGRIADAVARAAFNELVFGIGKRDTIGEAAYSESPHIAVPGGSGGGKSNLIAFLVIQELLRGSLVFILDPKATSHAWAINLPNVIYAVEAEEIRMALAWIAEERKRRSRNAHLSAAHDGIVRARPGRRLIGVCEELNVGMPEIKAEWVALRAKDKSLPAESPAIAGLRDTACAGRACDIHAFFVAQLFNVESTGVRDSAIRSQAGIKAMLRWDEPGWAMAVGKNPPMPPPVSTPGRIQLVTGGAAREVQVPYLHLDDEDHPAVHEKSVAWARELAVSKDVAKIPTGPDGVPRELWPPCVLNQAALALPAGQDGLSTMTSPDVPISGPPVVTLAEAVSKGIIGPTIQAVRKARSRGDFPEPVGERPGTGHPALLYNANDLHAWSRSRREDRRVSS